MPERQEPASPPPEDGEGSGRKPFLLRLPRPLHDELRAWAGEELRSLNGHIEYLLREAVRRRRRTDREGGAD